MLTNTFFQTKVSEDLDKISVKFKDTATNTDKTVTLPEGGINKYLANVGFNRLMSENNMLGASLSSDVDFKLVLDDEILKTDIKIANPGMTDEQAGKAVNDLKDQIVKTLEGTKETFEGDFNLTLEVQSFTVKSVSTLKRDAGTSDVEQNFLATVLHNNSYMSGNPQVMDKFVGIIKDNLTFNKVATRNFEQYLGDSDKGSIKAIKNLPQMEAVVSSAADIITASPDLTARAKTILHLDDSTTTEQLKQKLTSDPGLLKKLVTDKGDTTIKATLTNNDTIKNNLGNVDMFKGADLGEKLALTCKLVTTFTKTTEGEQNRNFIGREGVGANDNWVFSVKYAGCRLNDVFDSTPREVYAMSSNNVVKATKTFDDVKTIAEAINSFSIQIQNRTYEMESAKGTSHNDIDEMYDRVTGNEFASMVKDANTLPKLRTMVDNLVQSLTDSGSGSKEIMGTDNLKKLAEVQTALKDSGVTSLSDDQLRSLGHKLFDTMFTVTDKAANALKPEPPKVKYSHSQTV